MAGENPISVNDVLGTMPDLDPAISSFVYADTLISAGNGLSPTEMSSLLDQNLIDNFGLTADSMLEGPQMPVSDDQYLPIYGISSLDPMASFDKRYSAIAPSMLAFGDDLVGAGEYGASALADLTDLRDEIKAVGGDVGPVDRKIENLTNTLQIMQIKSAGQAKERRDNSQLYLGLGALIFSYWQSQQMMSFQEKQREKSIADQKEFMATAHAQTLEQIAFTAETEVAAKKSLAGPAAVPVAKPRIG